MSSNRKRLSLFAGSSLALAGLVGGAGLMLSAGQAAAAECTPPGQTGTKTCSGTLPDITYPATTGNLTLNLANDLVVTTGGISVVSPASSSVTIGRSNTGLATLDPTITSTSDAGIGVSSATGAITVDLTDPAFATGPGLLVTGATHGVMLETGSLSSNALRFTQTNGTITATAADGVGIQVETLSTTSGNATVNIGGLVTAATGVSATSDGTGTLAVNLLAASATVSGGEVVGTAGPAIRLSPTGNATVTLATGTTARAAVGPVIDITSVGAGRTVTISANGGTIRSNAGDLDDVIIQADGGAGNVTVNATTSGVQGTLLGQMDLHNTGNANINLNTTSIWRTLGSSYLGDGVTTLTHGPDALLVTNTDGADTELDFGDGIDIYTQFGVLAVGGGTEAPATLTLSSLGRWTLSGRTLFGANGANTASDGVANDRVIAEGAMLDGTGNARLMMDVDLSGSQSSCDTLTAADCLVLAGGGTMGSTAIVVNDISTAASFSADGILVVDVSGGTSDADHFVLDPGSTDYTVDPTLGGIIDRGLYFYDLAYDEDSQQHFILGMPKREALQLSTIGAAAQTVWRAMTPGRTDRGNIGIGLGQPEVGTAAGAWLKVTARTADRNLDQTGRLFTYQAETGYDQETVGLVGGVDLVSSPGAGQAYVAGVTAGYVKSEMTFKNSHTETTLTGPTLGAYGTFAAGPFFVDAIVNAAWLDAEFDAPGIGFTGDDLASGKVKSIGAQAEAGYRLPINDGEAYFEPLAALAYVTTDVEDFTFTGGELEADDVVSFRGSLGGRIGGEMPFEGYSLKMALTARHWQEFEGENRLTATSNGTAVELFDDVTGNYNEVGLDFGLYSGGAFQNLSILLGASIRFADDYKDSGGSLGFRYQW